MNATFRRSFTHVSGQRVIAGSGHIVERVITLPQMSRVCIGSAFKATLTVDPHHRGEIALRIRADDSVLPFVVAEPRAGAIFVGLRTGAFSGVTELSVVATLGSLSELSAIHAASACVHNAEGEEVTLHADNGSHLVACGRAQRWTLRLANASRGHLSFNGSAAVHVQLATCSHLSLAGSAAVTEIEANTTSTVLGTRPAFETRRAHVKLGGLSHARLCVRDAISGELRGFSRLFVSGEARIDVKGAVHRE